MKPFLSFIVLATIAISSVLSCQKGPEEIRVSSISLSKSTLELTVGDQVSLDVTISPDNATNKKISWSSSKESVATVTPDGIVDAVSAGTSIITATSEDQGKTASCIVTVPEKMVAVAVTGDATHVSCRNARISGIVTLHQTRSPYFSFGVLYSTSSDILLENAIWQQATEADADNYFTVDSGVLEPETTYYYKSYVNDDYGMSYGQTKSFKTLPLSSMIQTLDAGDIVLEEATLNAMLDLTDCKYNSIEYGFELTPESGRARTLTANNLADKAFSYRDKTLSRNTVYSYVAYVKLDGIPYKAEPKTFTTSSIQVSVTAAASDIQCKSATILGRLSVQSEGSFSKSAEVYYSSSENTLAGLKSNGTKETLTLEEDGSYRETLSSLSPSTSYNFIVVAKVDDVEFVSAIGNFSTLTPPSGSVDLGLSVLWASCNLGASKPSEYGGYYQWAGTKDVSDTSIDLYWSNCPYHTGSDEKTGWTKYNTNSSYGTKDNRTVLEPMDDAASVALGGKWRMPTDDEWEELLNTDNTSWTWTTIDGVYGYKVQSNKPGYTDNWIFLPAAGFRSFDSLLKVGSYGNYWSSSLNTGDPSDAYYMHFLSPYNGRSTGYRYYGQSVRPVSE